MKKFKLTQNDATSLENATSLMSNLVLKNAAFDVTNGGLTGGEWVKAGPITFGKVLPDPK